MTQYGFFIDLSRCVGCNACVISCKQWHDVPPGPVKWLRVYQWEKGNFPDIDLRVLPIMCFHCENPVCLEACTNRAIYKDEKYGAVLVDTDKCKGERDCWKACPYGTPQFAGDEPGLKMSKCNMCMDRLEQGNQPICVLSCSMRALEFGPIEELREKYGDLNPLAEMPKASGGSQDQALSSCANHCPLRMNIPRFMELYKEQRIEEAFESVLLDNPLPASTGRVCQHPCDTGCRRQIFDESVNIRDVHRRIADTMYASAGFEQVASRIVSRRLAGSGRKIAVVGAGPAGLTAAFYLALLGHEVTVFEEKAEAGGMLRFAIPEYRLPKAVLRREIELIERLGVKFVFNCRVGLDLPLNEMKDRFDIVFLSIGTWQESSVSLPGSELKGVRHALPLLGELAGRKAEVGLGRKVAVIGGGNAAIDSARSARRAGAEVTVFYRRERKDMPAIAEETRAAQEEGVRFVFLATPHCILGDAEGMVQALELEKTRLGERDQSGRRKPLPTGEMQRFECDTVILAVGETFDLEFGKASGLERKPGGALTVDCSTLETSRSGFYAGGDAIAGATNVSTAMGFGKQGARSIDQRLMADDRWSRIFPEFQYSQTVPAEALESARQGPHSIGAEQRLGSQQEVVTGFSPEEALAEANRCLRCDAIKSAVVFKPVQPKVPVVTWDSKRALELWQCRHSDTGESLPPIFANISDVLDMPQEIIGRNKLSLKAASVQEALLNTLDDE